MRELLGGGPKPVEGDPKAELAASPSRRAPQPPLRHLTTAFHSPQLTHGPHRHVQRVVHQTVRTTRIRRRLGERGVERGRDAVRVARRAAAGREGDERAGKGAVDRARDRDRLPARLCVTIFMIALVYDNNKRTGMATQRRSAYSPPSARLSLSFSHACRDPPPPPPSRDASGGGGGGTRDCRRS